MTRKKDYSAKENRIIIKEVKKHPDNLHKCFIAVSKKLHRTPEGIKCHYYSFLAENKKPLNPWKPEEDEIIAQAVKAHPQNLQECFRNLSANKVLNRTDEAITARYYSFVAKNCKDLYKTMSESKYMENYKIKVPAMQATPQKNTKSKWRRILEILRGNKKKK